MGFFSRKSGASTTKPRHVTANTFQPRLEHLETRTLLAIVPGTVVNITQEPGNQSEVQLAINPANNMNMIMGPNDLNSLFGPGIDNVWTTMDGGTTWSQVAIPNPIGAMAAGDPSVTFDRTGRAVYTHLITDATGGLGVASAVSNDGGLTWTAGLITPVSTALFNDHQYVVAGPDVNNLATDRFYTAWQQAGAGNIVVASSSTDGINWTPFVQVSDTLGTLDSPLAVGANGELYVAFQDISQANQARILVDRSLDGGLTFGTDVLIATTNVNGFNDNGGLYNIPAQATRGLRWTLSMDIDRASNRLYVAYHDRPDNRGHDDLDIFVQASDDGGLTWNALGQNPVRVNDDNTTNSQFFPWLSVDQSSGNVGVGWYDTRNDPNNVLTEYHVAISANRGESFQSNIQLAQGQTNANVADPGNQYGDYSGTAFAGGVLYGVWSDNSNSTADNPDGAGAALDVYIGAAQGGGVGGVFAVDVSQSMVDAAGFDANGDNLFNSADDLNNDGVHGSLLDVMIGNILSLTSGSSSQVALVIYGSTAKPLDLSPESGVQAVVNGDADADGNGISDFEEALRSLRVGGGGKFAAATVEAEHTRYDAVLDSFTSLLGDFTFPPDLNLFTDGAGRLQNNSTTLNVLASASLGVRVSIFGLYQVSAPTTDAQRIATATNGAVTTFATIRRRNVDGGFPSTVPPGSVAGIGRGEAPASGGLATVLASMPENIRLGTAQTNVFLPPPTDPVVGGNNDVNPAGGTVPTLSGDNGTGDNGAADANTNDLQNNPNDLIANNLLEGSGAADPLDAQGHDGHTQGSAGSDGLGGDGVAVFQLDAAPVPFQGTNEESHRDIDEAMKTQETVVAMENEEHLDLALATRRRRPMSAFDLLDAALVTLDDHNA